MLNFKVKFPTILHGYDLRDVEEWEQQSLPRVDFVVWFAMVLTDVWLYEKMDVLRFWNMQWKEECGQLFSWK